MRKIAILCALLVGFVHNADAATAQNPRGGSAGTTESSEAQSATRAATARSATNTRSASRSASATTAAARAATTGRTTVSRTTSDADTSTNARSAVVARAGATQKVLNTSTSIAAANENVVVSEECRQKYYGCMDSFCMIDNDSGGRCICNDRIFDLDDVLAQIEKLDQQTYQMATYGVERIEMGDAAEIAIANATAVANEILNSSENSILPDLTTWFDPVDAQEDLNVFDEEVKSLFQSPIENKEGDDLYQASHEICEKQIPECEAEMEMLQLMYAQQIRSDCSAFENSLKQQRNSSAQKLYAAEQALRDAALEQYQTANKYNLGQCVVEFKKCMIETGECGEDFSGCASVAAFDATNTRGNEKSKWYSVAGTMTKIQIKASTYDTLMAKRPLCEGITSQCVTANGGKDGEQVWLTFLREVAPQVKAAELIAEDNVRQNCIGNISSCFQTACKDTMDPDDPDGSYDLCLTDPYAMFSLCTVPLNACGISSEKGDRPDDYNDINDPDGIWDYVVARLESMRVNSCTSQVRDCLQSVDRCGEDYTQCIGLDTDTIIRMCPEELLVGCRNYRVTDTSTLSTTGWTERDKFYANIEPLVQGIMLNIDNSLLNECQRVADESMISVCGVTENCDGLAVDQYVGTNTLEYKICQVESIDGTKVKYSNCYTEISQISDEMLGRDATLSQTYGITESADADGNTPKYQNIDSSLADAMLVNAKGGAKLAIIIEGEIPWNAISFDDETGEILIDEATIQGDADQVKNIKTELGVLQNNINNAINTIESDPWVQFCTSGRIVQGVNDDERTNITSSVNKPAIQAAMESAQKDAALTLRGGLGAVTTNSILDNQTMVDRTGTGGRFPGLTQQMRAKIAASAIKIATQNYNSKYQELEEKRMQDYVTLGERVAQIQNENLEDARRESARYACTGVASSSAVATSSIKNSSSSEQRDDLVGAKQVNNWNYKETVTSTFNWETLVCHRCIRKQNCLKPKGSGKWCKIWEDPVETCDDIQF